KTFGNLWTDISWNGITSEGGVILKNGKKPEKLIARILDIATEPGDIVFDFHLGSGTTPAVAHKMGRQFIGIEQLDYGLNDAPHRLMNVIQGDTTGISKRVNWKGGGDFVYCELMKYNERFIEDIDAATDTKKLLKIWEEIKKHAFVKYNVDLQVFDKNIVEFKRLPLPEKKKILLQTLDKNQLYVNLSEIDDADFKVQKEDKEMNKEFYGK
ncbi:MAG: site-specific DNA-methyltransferase, partial [Patescibacteria group bacterium]